MKENNIKDFYRSYSDEIINKRFRSTSLLRRYAHLQQYENILKFIKKGTKVLDAGCGEGVLSVLMAQKGANIVGCDLSKPNIERCITYAKENGIHNIEFVVGDAENLPFEDNSFDIVVSSHVLEHLPDFNKGLIEVMRVTNKRAIVAIPTILNLCSFVQVGHGWFYLKGVKSFLGLFLGGFKALTAFIFCKDGVNESYVGKGLPHIFRFPWVMKRKIHKFNYRLVFQEASSICLPYFEFFLPLIKFLDKYKDKKILRNFGYGTTYVIDK